MTLRPARKQLGERRPPRAQHAMPLHQDALLFRRPLTASDVGLEVVEPPIAALLPPSPLHLTRNEAPLSVPVLVHQLAKQIILLQRPLLRRALERPLRTSGARGRVRFIAVVAAVGRPRGSLPGRRSLRRLCRLGAGLRPAGRPRSLVDAAAFFAGAAPFLSGTIPFRSSFDAACARKNGEEGDKGSAGATGGAVKNIPRVARETNVLGRYC